MRGICGYRTGSNPVLTTILIFMGMLRKIKYWFEYEGRYLHKDFIKGVKNLWKWFPTIWKDREHDYHFILVLLEKKLNFQSKYIGYKNRHSEATRDSERMMTCVRLIQKIKEDYYNTEYVDYQKSEFHFDPIPDRPTHKQLRIEEISDNFDDYFKIYPRIYKKVFNELDVDQRNSKRIIAIRMSWENHNRAKKLLFKMMENHIESWWD